MTHSLWHNPPHALHRGLTILVSAALVGLNGPPSALAAIPAEGRRGSLGAAEEEQRAPLRDPHQLRIPKELGRVVDVFSPQPAGEPASRLIIHLQDLHTQYAVQRTLARLIDHLHNTASVSLVALEGGAGPGDTAFFSAFPDKETTDRLADFFLRKGLFTGSVYYAVTHPGTVSLYGAEDAAVYLDHLKTYQDAHPKQQEAATQLKAVSAVLKERQRALYPEALKTLSATAEALEAGTLRLSNDLSELLALAREQDMALTAYPNLRRLHEMATLQAGLDMEAVQEEHDALRDRLIDELSDEAYEAFEAHEDALADKSISYAAYLKGLAPFAKHLGIDLSASRAEEADPYANLKTYTEVLRIDEGLEHEQLAPELKALLMALRDTLLTTDAQRQLAQLTTTLGLVQGLIDVRLSPEELAYYEAHQADFTAQPFLRFLEQQKQLTPALRQAITALFADLSSQERFYELAQKRDEALVANTLEQMRTQKQAVALLIAGGFHTEGFTRLLKDQEVAYAVISPAVDGEMDETLYSSLLLSEVPALEDLVRELSSEVVRGNKSKPAQWDDDSLVQSQGITSLDQLIQVMQAKEPALGRTDEGKDAPRLSKRSYLQAAWVLGYVAGRLSQEGVTVQKVIEEVRQATHPVARQVEILEQSGNRLQVAINGATGTFEVVDQEVVFAVELQEQATQVASVEPGAPEILPPGAGAVIPPTTPEEGTEGLRPYTGAGDTSIHKALDRARELRDQGNLGEAGSLLQELLEDLRRAQETQNVSMLMDKWNERMGADLPVDLFLDDLPAAIQEAEVQLAQLERREPEIRLSVGSPDEPPVIGRPSPVFATLAQADERLTAVEIASQLTEQTGQPIAASTIEHDLGAMVKRGLVLRQGKARPQPGEPPARYWLSVAARAEVRKIQPLLEMLPRARPTAEDWKNIEPVLDGLRMGQRNLALWKSAPFSFPVPPEDPLSEFTQLRLQTNRTYWQDIVDHPERYSAEVVTIAQAHLRTTSARMAALPIIHVLEQQRDATEAVRLLKEVPQELQVEVVSEMAVLLLQRVTRIFSSILSPVLARDDRERRHVEYFRVFFGNVQSDREFSEPVQAVARNYGDIWDEAIDQAIEEGRKAYSDFQQRRGMSQEQQEQEEALLRVIVGEEKRQQRLVQETAELRERVGRAVREEDPSALRAALSDAMFLPSWRAVRGLLIEYYGGGWEEEFNRLISYLVIHSDDPRIRAVSAMLFRFFAKSGNQNPVELLRREVVAIPEEVKAQTEDFDGVVRQLARAILNVEQEGPEGLRPYTGAGDTSIHKALDVARELREQGNDREATELLQELLEDLRRVDETEDIATLMDKWNERMEVDVPVDLLFADLPAAVREVENLLEEVRLAAQIRALTDRFDWVYSVVSTRYQVPASGQQVLSEYVQDQMGLDEASATIPREVLVAARLAITHDLSEYQMNEIVSALRGERERSKDEYVEDLAAADPGFDRVPLYSIRAAKENARRLLAEAKALHEGQVPSTPEDHEELFAGQAAPPALPRIVTINPEILNVQSVLAADPILAQFDTVVRKALDHIRAQRRPLIYLVGSETLKTATGLATLVTLRNEIAESGATKLVNVVYVHTDPDVSQVDLFSSLGISSEELFDVVVPAAPTDGVREQIVEAVNTNLAEYRARTKQTVETLPPITELTRENTVTLATNALGEAVSEGALSEEETIFHQLVENAIHVQVLQPASATESVEQQAVADYSTAVTSTLLAVTETKDIPEPLQQEVAEVRQAARERRTVRIAPRVSDVLHGIDQDFKERLLTEQVLEIQG